jgi:hypothetical protein
MVKLQNGASANYGIKLGSVPEINYKRRTKVQTAAQAALLNSLSMGASIGGPAVLGVDISNLSPGSGNPPAYTIFGGIGGDVGAYGLPAEVHAGASFTGAESISIGEGLTWMGKLVHGEGTIYGRDPVFRNAPSINIK